MTLSIPGSAVTLPVSAGITAVFIHDVHGQERTLVTVPDGE